MKGRRYRWWLFAAGALGLQLISSCGKKCKDWVTMPYPSQVHVYMEPYKLGNWWVYENSFGLRDSVYVSHYDWFQGAVDPSKRPCLGIPRTEFILRTMGMDTTGMIYVGYSVSPNGSAGVDITADRFAGWPLVGFGYGPAVGLTSVHTLDTVINSVIYNNAIRVDRRAHAIARHLESILMAPGIGIVGYITQTDTFNLLHYQVL